MATLIHSVIVRRRICLRGIVQGVGFRPFVYNLANRIGNPDLDNTPIQSVTAFGVEVKPGDRVRIWPQKSADIMDMALKGKVAIVEAIERDFDDQVHVAVVIEDDPGRDLGMLRQLGHRFFFSPEEVEPLALNGEVSRER